MGRKGKRVDRGSGGAKRGASSALHVHSSRAANEPFVLTGALVALLAETVGARPDLAPLFDLRRIDPGSESIESLSWRAHEWLCQRGFDRAVFKVFSELNAARTLAEISRAVDEAGLPCEEHEVLAELFARLQRYYCFRGSTTGAPLFEVGSAAFDALGRERSVFRGVAAAARAIVAEQLQAALAGAIPIEVIEGDHGRPLAVAPGTALIVDAARHLGQRRQRLPLAQLKRWVAHALFKLSADERRLLHLRSRRQLEIHAIAARFGLAPFEAGLRLRQALHHLLDELDTLLFANDPRAAGAVKESPSQAGGGRVVVFPRWASSNRAADPATAPANADEECADRHDDGGRDG
ncbi:MAG: hypothetical protein EXS13_14410 [Planctomycetes bacterium]|nr:hypothetical protein [Planctomycetota bacterium]